MEHIGSTTQDVKEHRAQTREMGDAWKYSFHAVDTCRYRVLTRLRRNVSFIDPNPMPMAMTPIGIGTIGRHCRPVHRIDIKGLQCFDHCFTEGHLRGTPWSLLSCREAKRRANVGANDQRACGRHVQAIAIDGGLIH